MFILTSNMKMKSLFNVFWFCKAGLLISHCLSFPHPHQVNKWNDLMYFFLKLRWILWLHLYLSNQINKNTFSFSSTLHLLNLLSYIVHHKHYRVIKWFYFYSPGLINKICFQRKNTRNYKNKTHFPSSSSGKQSQI